MDYIFIALNMTFFSAILILVLKYNLNLKNDSKNIGNLKNLQDLFLNSKSVALNYRKLHQTNLEYLVKSVFLYNGREIFAGKEISNNKNYILTLSKYIDYKIDKNKLKFRCKNDFILIEEIAYILTKKLLISGQCEVFKNFKLLVNEYALKQKEIKIFKILFAKNLILQICQEKRELTQISKIIEKSKNANFLQNYRKMIYKSAQIYSILQYNKNATKILSLKDLDINKHCRELFYELFYHEQRLKLMLTYTKVLFN